MRPKPATGGQVTLYVNDKAVGGGRMDHTVPMRFSGYAGMDIGRDNGGVVDRSYAAQGAVPLHAGPSARSSSTSSRTSSTRKRSCTSRRSTPAAAHALSA